MRINPEDYYISKEKNGYHKIAEKNGSKNGIIDKELNIIIAPIYEVCSDASDTAFWLYDFSSSNHKDLNGVDDFEIVLLTTLENFNQIRHEIFDTYTAYPSQFLYFAKVVNKLILPNFDEQRNLLPGNCWYFENGKYGLIQKDGKVIIEPSLDKVKLNYNGKAIIKKEKEYAVIDNYGKLIIPFTANRIVYWGDNKYTQEKAKEKKTEQIVNIKDKGEEKMGYCSFCGAEMAEDANFCSKCGKKRGEKQGTTNKKSSSLPTTILFTYTVVNTYNFSNIKIKTEERFIWNLKEILIFKMKQVWQDKYVLRIEKGITINQRGNLAEFSYYPILDKGNVKFLYDTFMEFLIENQYKIRMIGNNSSGSGTTTNNCIAERYE